VPAGSSAHRHRRLLPEVVETMQKPAPVRGRGLATEAKKARAVRGSEQQLRADRLREEEAAERRAFHDVRDADPFAVVRRRREKIRRRRVRRPSERLQVGTEKRASLRIALAVREGVLHRVDDEESAGKEGGVAFLRHR